MEAVKAMIHDQDLPMHLWAEAARNAVYVQKKSPHIVLENKTPEEMFTGEKLEVSHLRIFGCPVYVHVPKDKRSKLDPSGNKGIFVGYNETLKAYRVYILGHRQIETSRDVTFDEDTTFSRLRQRHSDEVHDEEREAPRVTDTDACDDVILEDHDMEEPQMPIDSSREMNNKKRRQAWAREIIQDAEKYGFPDGSFRERKRPRPYSSYVALLSDIIDAEPTSYEEVAKKKEWKDAMVEEYQSIVKNDVWDVVPRPKEKTIGSSKWIYKTKLSTDGSIEKYKARFVARGFSQKEGIDYEEAFAPVARYTSIRAILALAVVKK
jgi:hypothetical protein